VAEELRRLSVEAERAKYVAPRLQEEMAAVLADNQLNQQQVITPPPLSVGGVCSPGDW